MNTVADTTLFQRWARERDPHAFAEIVRRHSGMVYGVCKRILGNEADAEDVAQDCFIELAKTQRPVKRSLAGWLHALAAARSLGRIRSDKSRQARERRYASAVSGEVPRDAETNWSDVWSEVDEAIAGLPEEVRESIVGCFLEGQTQEVVAERLGTSRSTVQRRLDEGVERIRVSLRKRGVIATTAALVTAFGAHTAEAAPAALVANLGKLALSGGVASGAAGTATTVAVGGAGLKTAAAGGGGLIMVAKVAAGVSAVCIAVGALWAEFDAERKKDEAGASSVSQRPISMLEEPASAGQDGVSINASALGDLRIVEPQLVAERVTPANNRATATLRGRLVDSRGLPVGKARANTSREEGRKPLFIETDETGAFEARDVAPGRYSFTEASYQVDHIGGLWIGGLHIEPAEEVVAESGRPKEDVVIALAEPIGRATLNIRVVNQRGAPVPGAAVAVRFSEGAVCCPVTDKEGWYRRYHAPDWESEAQVEVSHRDYETETFVVPIAEEEVKLVLNPKATKSFSLRVVDGKTGIGIPNAEVREDGDWQPTQSGVIVLTGRSVAKHRFEARAPEYQAASWDFSLESEETKEGIIKLFRPATVRLEFDVQEPMTRLLPEFNRGRARVSVGVTDMKEVQTLGKMQWEGDFTATYPIGAEQPSDVVLSLHGKTHKEDSGGTDTVVTVSGVVVGQGQEVRLRYTIGRGTCVLEFPKIKEGWPYAYLIREGDRPGVKVENARYEGVSETRLILANSANVYVAGDLYPGTYLLRYDRGYGSEDQLITFTRENEEIVLDWE